MQYDAFPKECKKFKGRLSLPLQILLHPISNSRKVWNWRDNVFKNMNLQKKVNAKVKPRKISEGKCSKEQTK